MNTATLTQPRPQNPLDRAKLKLIKDFLALNMPAYPAFPSPDDHNGFANVIRDAAQIFDEWLAAVGSEVRDNATGAIDSHLFAGSFTAAIDGNETYACECAGMSVREERAAMRRTA